MARLVAIVPVPIVMTTVTGALPVVTTTTIVATDPRRVVVDPLTTTRPRADGTRTPTDVTMVPRRTRMSMVDPMIDPRVTSLLGRAAMGLVRAAAVILARTIAVAVVVVTGKPLHSSLLE